MQQTLVFLHNGFDHAKTWSPVIDELSKILPAGTCYVAEDRAGYGTKTSQVPENLYTTDLVKAGVEELEALLLGKRGTVILCGHCIGGAIAVSYAARHPDGVAGVFCEASGFFHDELIDLKLGLVFPEFDIANQGIKTQLTAEHGEAHARMIWDVIRNNHAGYLMSPRYDISKEARSLTCPLYLLWGSQDVYFGKSYIRQTKLALPNAATSVLPDFGHDIHRQDPKIFAHILKAFIDTCA